MTIDDVIRGFTDLDSPAVFDEMMRVVLTYQYAHNPVYRRYCKAIYPEWSTNASPARKRLPIKNPWGKSSEVEAICLPTARHPIFLPVEAFKRAPVTTFLTGGGGKSV